MALLMKTFAHLLILQEEAVNIPMSLFFRTAQM